MALITPSNPGSALTHRAAAAGDTYANSGHQQLHVVNAAGAPITAHLVKQATCSFGQSHATDTSDDFVVGAGGDLILPSVAPEIYNDTNGQVHVTYSSVTSVTVGVIS